MKIDSPWLNGLAGLLSASLLRRWMCTLDCKVAYYDPSVDPSHPDYSGHKLFIFWHEYIAFPVALRGHCNVSILLSQHRDADILAKASHHLGFKHIRGSTFQGASAALRQLIRLSKESNLAWGCDGPRGPRRVLGQGPIYLSSKLRMPLVLMGYGYDRPWRLKSWDRFAVPRPGSRARAVWSPAITIPPNLDRDGIEHHRLLAEQLLNRLTSEAEAWAEAGTPKIGEMVMPRKFAQSRPFRIDKAHSIAAPHSAALLPKANRRTETAVEAR